MSDRKRLTRIYTRSGDRGRTRLSGGQECSKSDGRIQAYGTVDELSSVLGVARACNLGRPEGAEQRAQIEEWLVEVQNDLFFVGAELATAPQKRSKLEPGVSRATSEMVERVEGWIDEAVAEGELPREFVVPGESPLEAALEVARATVRRAERRVVSLARCGGLDGSDVPVYLNRLADLTYVLARSAAPEWRPSRAKEK